MVSPKKVCVEVCSEVYPQYLRILPRGKQSCRMFSEDEVILD